MNGELALSSPAGCLASACTTAAIEQCRREIGTYVDDKEVARLERYVKIR